MTESTEPITELPDSLTRLHDDPVDAATTLRERAGDTDVAEQVGCLFAALSNPQRLQLLWALRDGECCVCELQTALDAPQSTVASHLRCLTDAGLVSTRKDGKWSYYRPADPAVFELVDDALAIADVEATE
ncbi:ArsR/SmtB family transcription factor [Halonotius pteroides]|uniref:Transcriptional regulator n=1 Tax=Halonotius pteroides TaxID=268735 RepID=A0A3A6QSW3_9EURY|nr:metalloregulator ArsR/SmtB family transcription factor [Halonotius pteroides]RJX51587.1 transcriptional regulator [Halonotius pteroides]